MLLCPLERSGLDGTDEEDPLHDLLDFAGEDLFERLGDFDAGDVVALAEWPLLTRPKEPFPMPAVKDEP